LINDPPPACLLIADDNTVRTLTLNRPEKRNALNTELTQTLLDSLLAADRDERISVIVLAGAGRAFCAGADVSEFSSFTPGNSAAVNARAELTTRLQMCIPAMSKPVIAAVQGSAMGGGAGLALACDLLIMANDAAIVYPEVKRGIVAATVMSNLVRQVGRKLAFELVITGCPLTAQRALALGIANNAVAPEALQQTTSEFAHEIGKHSITALRATKTLFHRVAELSFEEGMDEGRKANIAMRGYSNTEPTQVNLGNPCE
jgi:enoyl-CoA hydratase/carnithine racemase